MIGRRTARARVGIAEWENYSEAQKRALLKALRDASPATRRETAMDILGTGDASTLEPLCTMVDLDRDEQHAGLAALQAIALRCLRALGDGVAREFLIAALQNPALLRMRAGSPLPTLLKKALAKLGYAHTTRTLFEILREHGCERVWAAMILGEIGDPAAVTPLCRALESSGEWTRRAAATALGRIRAPEAIAALCNVLADAREDAELRQQCAIALAEIGDRSAVPALCEVLPDRSDGVVYSATWALGQLEDGRAVEPLLELFESWPADFVAEALGNIGDSRAVETLCGALHRKEWPTVRAVIVALGRIGDPRAINPLLKLVERGGDFYPWDVVDALTHICGREAVERFCEALKSRSEAVRCLASEMLAQLNDPRARRNLRALRQDPSAAVRFGAALARSLLSKGPFPPLQELLADPDVDVRRAAVHELGLLDDPRAAGALEAARRDADACMRLLAAAAQGQAKQAAGELPHPRHWRGLDREFTCYEAREAYDYLRTRKLESRADSAAWEALLACETDELLAEGPMAAAAVQWALASWPAETCYKRWGREAFYRLLAAAGAKLAHEDAMPGGPWQLWRIRATRDREALLQEDLVVFRFRGRKDEVEHFRRVPPQVATCGEAMSWLARGKPGEEHWCRTNT
ncbi:MAG: HEAT repeat domain-containing protein [Planctomycetota bacterium]|nr:HEAT repeat domain-containing protein [Planctomycetota bacterium]